MKQMKSSSPLADPCRIGLWQGFSWGLGLSKGVLAGMLAVCSSHMQYSLCRSLNDI